ncbi:hypothetical protein [Dehalobacter sp. TeCB1]|uniref:hypothetical protein n=1 Tax=Dehalobacter sp. TeCB1 TaxID=1843715 RepID=UPI00083AE4DB|nr:hypothetical protein [Dehalobacter sp. TeCB1]OCZ50866.1 hypothetical protein A7D23_14180 [Dehalobacter sp. TeCB1]
MNVSQLKKIYEVNDLKDYELRNTEDLLKVHGIDFRDMAGYNRLDDLNKQLYSKFIVNFFNQQGLKSRISLIPKGIYFVEEIEYLIKEDPEDESWLIVGGLIKSIDKNGLKSVLHEWKNEDYNHMVFTENKPKIYLRFEYLHRGRDEWIRVISENFWG